MEWENKGKMIKLGNAMNNDEESKKAFQDFCLEHMAEFDGQSWDMFVTIITIDPEEMKSDIEFWEKAWPFLKDIDCSVEAFGLRAGMRVAMVQTICENQLNLKK